MDVENKKNDAPKDQGEKLSFFQSLFSNIFKTSNPEAEKKRKLKAIAKSFSKTKYHTFYNYYKKMYIRKN